MAQAMFRESEKDGRSVLGMLRVEVERDPKTGATVVKSVAPMSTPASGPLATTVFDDGRKSIHAIGGSGDQPSTEELTKNLTVVDGVGMQVMLDELTVTPNEAEVKEMQAPVNQPVSEENHMALHSHASSNPEAQMTTEVTRSSMTFEEDANVMVVRDKAGKEVTMEGRDLEESPITLVFLGYTDSTTTQEDLDMLTAERVIIAEDGEEHSATDQEVGQESQSVTYQDISPEDKDQTSEVQKDNANKDSSSPAVEERKGPSNNKTCHCCSVMLLLDDCGATISKPSVFQKVATMETNTPTQRCQSKSPTSQDDDDLLGRNSKLGRENTEKANRRSLSTPGEGPIGLCKVSDIEGQAHMFVPLPRSLPMGPVLPVDSRKDTTAFNSSVTVAFGASDDTEAKANPTSLCWQRSERQSMAAHREIVGLSADATQISGDFKDLIPNAEDHIPKAPLEETKKQDQSTVQVETQGDVDEERFPNNEDKFENEAHLDKVGDKIQQGDLTKPLGASKSNGMRLVPHGNITEFFKNKENMTARALTKPKEERQTESKENVEHFDIDSNDSLIESDKGTHEVQVHTEAFGKMHLTPSNEKQNKGRREKHRDEFWRIASEILQGEQLLQRLQLVQQRQEADMSTCQEVNRDREHGKKEQEDLPVEDEKKDMLEREKPEVSGSREVQEKMAAQPEDHKTATKVADCSDDSPSVSWVCADCIPINSIETISRPTSLRSSCHRFSVTEMSKEKLIHEDSQGKQKLQRAGGILNLADDPDVLEIPFNTNIVFELLPTKKCQGQEREWQFSEQMMLDDEIIREGGKKLGATAQGETPEELIKEEAHQLKKTRMLFEAFQQDNTQGPTRLRKPLSTSMTDQFYPTVLERTRSLDMFSTSQKVKSSENLHTKIPSGGCRDRARLFPYPKQDKNVCFYKSSDSINSDVSTHLEENGNSVATDKVKQEAPMLEQNPFFKLRPALALKPEVEKEICEAKAREDEFRRQRRDLYRENRQSTEEVDKLPYTPTVTTGVKQQSRGKLERVWPPPCKKEHLKSEQTQGPSLHKPGSQRSLLWQRWEFGRINGQPAPEKD